LLIEVQRRRFRRRAVAELAVVVLVVAGFWYGIAPRVAAWLAQ